MTRRWCCASYNSIVLEWLSLQFPPSRLLSISLSRMEAVLHIYSYSYTHSAYLQYHTSYTSWASFITRICHWPRSMIEIVHPLFSLSLPRSLSFYSRIWALNKETWWTSIYSEHFFSSSFRTVFLVSESPEQKQGIRDRRGAGTVELQECNHAYQTHANLTYPFLSFPPFFFFRYVHFQLLWTPKKKGRLTPTKARLKARR